MYYNLKCKVRFNDDTSVVANAMLLAFVSPVDGANFQKLVIAGSDNVVEHYSGDAVVVLEELCPGKPLQLPLRLISEIEWECA
jgi:ethanolamine utilization microcompartment shell protein EutL